MERKIVKRKILEFLLAKVKPHPAPKIFLEQFSTPPELAANILCTATYSFDDVVGRSVCDLGCGGGIFAIGAAYLGAEYTVGIDIDRLAVTQACRTARELGIDVDWVIGDIALLREKFDTVIQNPPFGVRRHGMDRVFLEKALSIADTVYSIHKGGKENRKFIEKTVVEKLNGQVTSVVEAELVIPYMFNFHRKQKYRITVDVYRIVKR